MQQSTVTPAQAPSSKVCKFEETRSHFGQSYRNCFSPCWDALGHRWGNKLRVALSCGSDLNVSSVLLTRASPCSKLHNGQSSKLDHLWASQWRGMYTKCRLSNVDATTTVCSLQQSVICKVENGEYIKTPNDIFQTQKNHITKEKQWTQLDSTSTDINIM